jgi:hypothetical protein
MLDGQVQLCFIRQSLSSSESSSIEGKFLNTPQARPCLLGVVYCLGIVFLVLFCIKRCVCLHMIPECFRWSSCDACFHILCCLICSSPLSNCSFELAVCSDSCGFLFEFRVVVYQKRGRSWLFSFSFHSHYSPSALASNLAQRSPCLETRNLKRQTSAVRFPLGCGCLYHVPLLCLPCCCCTFKRSCCFSNCRCLVFLAAASSALARVRAGCSAGTGAGRVRIRPTPYPHLRWHMHRPSWTQARPRPRTSRLQLSAVAGVARRCDGWGRWGLSAAAAEHQKWQWGLQLK